MQEVPYNHERVNASLARIAMFGEYVFQQPSRDACVLLLDAESYVSPKAPLDSVFGLLDHAYSVTAALDTAHTNADQHSMPGHELLR